MKPVPPPGLIQSLVCPETRQPLRAAAPDELAELLSRAQHGGPINRDGRRIETPLDGLLIREDGKIGYPVVAGIPIMLIGCGITLGSG